MSEQFESPWAKPGTDQESPVVVAYPPQPPASPGGPTGDERHRPPAGGPVWSRPGAVTQLGGAPPAAEPDVVEFGPPRTPDAVRRRTLLWFGGAAGVLAAIGLAVLVLLAMTGNGPIAGGAAPGPPDVLPPLAKACPPPTGDALKVPPAPPPAPGPRTVDSESGISYARYGAPWVPWDEVWDAGDLHVKYGVGQHFVTETYALGDYHASILSGSVPAAENDALSLDLKCTGHQVLADVRASYYPQPNTIDKMRDEVGSLGGRPAWISKFRLHFHEAGLQATSELVGLALIDVGRPNAAIIYVSIPNTVGQYDPLVDQVLQSVRPT
jgi:hypothetical protein